MLLLGFLLFDTSGFASEITHIVNASSANTANLDKLNASNRGTVNREGSFDADAAGDFTNREGFADSVATTLNDNSFVELDALLLVFDDANVHPDGVAARERGGVFPNLAGGDLINDVSIHC